MCQASRIAQFEFDNSYADRLPGFYVTCSPAVVADPVLLQFNATLAEELGLDSELNSKLAARIFSGAELPIGAQPLAQAYAGHQFGGFVPQLGDGRALLVGELLDRHGRRRDIAFKGSGPTPFSRGGDGKAAVGPVLREYLIGEAMHSLKVPTTRALAAVSTGETVMREQPLPGAILTRVAASHVRVGTFEYFAARQRTDQVRTLADFVIERHDPVLLNDSDRYLSLLDGVLERQAALLARWMHVGFIHGVMNTDNMAISGETIDYGPCAFMESYSPRAVFSSIDSLGRYAYGNQPTIACWNLARFAETLLPLIDANLDRAIAKATELIEGFMSRYESLWLAGARAKLGLTGAAPDSEDGSLARDWLDLMEQNAVDFTLGWRRLSDAASGNPKPLESLFPNADIIGPWLDRWQRRLASQSASSRSVAEAMRTANPIYIPRNHLVEEALTAASDHGDLTLFARLLDAVANPFEEKEGLAKYAQPAAREFTDCYKTFCGT